MDLHNRDLAVSNGFAGVGRNAISPADPLLSSTITHSLVDITDTKIAVGHRHARECKNAVWHATILNLQAKLFNACSQTGAAVRGNISTVMTMSMDSAMFGSIAAVLSLSAMNWGNNLIAVKPVHTPFAHHQSFQDWRACTPPVILSLMGPTEIALVSNMVNEYNNWVRHDVTPTIFAVCDMYSREMVSYAKSVGIFIFGLDQNYVNHNFMDLVDKRARSGGARPLWMGIATDHHKFRDGAWWFELAHMDLEDWILSKVCDSISDAVQSDTLDTFLELVKMWSGVDAKTSPPPEEKHRRECSHIEYNAQKGTITYAPLSSYDEGAYVFRATNACAVLEGYGETRMEVSKSSVPISTAGDTIVSLCGGAGLLKSKKVGENAYIVFNSAWSRDSWFKDRTMFRFAVRASYVLHVISVFSQTVMDQTVQNALARLMRTADHFNECLTDMTVVNRWMVRALNMHRLGTDLRGVRDFERDDQPSGNPYVVQLIHLGCLIHVVHQLQHGGHIMHSGLNGPTVPLLKKALRLTIWAGFKTLLSTVPLAGKLYSAIFYGRARQADVLELNQTSITWFNGSDSQFTRVKSDDIISAAAEKLLNVLPAFFRVVIIRTMQGIQYGLVPNLRTSTTLYLPPADDMYEGGFCTTYLESDATQTPEELDWMALTEQYKLTVSTVEHTTFVGDCLPFVSGKLNATITRVLAEYDHVANVGAKSKKRDAHESLSITHAGCKFLDILGAECMENKDFKKNSTFVFICEAPGNALAVACMAECKIHDRVYTKGSLHTQREEIVAMHDRTRFVKSLKKLHGEVFLFDDGGVDMEDRAGKKALREDSKYILENLLELDAVTKLTYVRKVGANMHNERHAISHATDAFILFGLAASKNTEWYEKYVFVKGQKRKIPCPQVGSVLTPWGSVYDISPIMTSKWSRENILSVARLLLDRDDERYNEFVAGFAHNDWFVYVQAQRPTRPSWFARTLSAVSCPSVADCCCCCLKKKADTGPKPVPLPNGARFTLCNYSSSDDDEGDDESSDDEGDKWLALNNAFPYEAPSAPTVNTTKHTTTGTSDAAPSCTELDKPANNIFPQQTPTAPAVETVSQVLDDGEPGSSGCVGTIDSHDNNIFPKQQPTAPAIGDEAVKVEQPVEGVDFKPLVRTDNAWVPKTVKRKQQELAEQTTGDTMTKPVPTEPVEKSRPPQQTPKPRPTTTPKQEPAPSIQQQDKVVYPKHNKTDLYLQPTDIREIVVTYMAAPRRNAKEPCANCDEYMFELAQCKLGEFLTAADEKLSHHKWLLIPEVVGESAEDRSRKTRGLLNKQCPLQLWGTEGDEYVMSILEAETRCCAICTGFQIHRSADEEPYVTAHDLLKVVVAILTVKRCATTSNKQVAAATIDKIVQFMQKINARHTITDNMCRSCTTVSTADAAGSSVNYITPAVTPNVVRVRSTCTIINLDGKNIGEKGKTHIAPRTEMCAAGANLFCVAQNNGRCTLKKCTSRKTSECWTYLEQGAQVRLRRNKCNCDGKVAKCWQEMSVLEKSVCAEMWDVKTPPTIGRLHELLINLAHNLLDVKVVTELDGVTTEFFNPVYWVPMHTNIESMPRNFVEYTTSNTLVIYGVYGAGKTVTLKRWISEFVEANENWQVVVWSTLREVSRAYKSVRSPRVSTIHVLGTPEHTPKESELMQTFYQEQTIHIFDEMAQNICVELYSKWVCKKKPGPSTLCVCVVSPDQPTVVANESKQVETATLRGKICSWLLNCPHIKMNSTFRSAGTIIAENSCGPFHYSTQLEAPEPGDVEIHPVSKYKPDVVHNLLSEDAEHSCLIFDSRDEVEEYMRTHKTAKYTVTTSVACTGGTYNTVVYKSNGWSLTGNKVSGSSYTVHQNANFRVALSRHRQKFIMYKHGSLNYNKAVTKLTTAFLNIDTSRGYAKQITYGGAGIQVVAHNNSYKWIGKMPEVNSLTAEPAGYTTITDSMYLERGGHHSAFKLSDSMGYRSAELAMYNLAGEHAIASLKAHGESMFALDTSDGITVATLDMKDFGIGPNKNTFISDSVLNEPIRSGQHFKSFMRSSGLLTEEADFNPHGAKIQSAGDLQYAVLTFATRGAQITNKQEIDPKLASVISALHQRMRYLFRPTIDDFVDVSVIASNFIETQIVKQSEEDEAITKQLGKLWNKYVYDGVDGTASTKIDVFDTKPKTQVKLKLSTLADKIAGAEQELKNTGFAVHLDDGLSSFLKKDFAKGGQPVNVSKNWAVWVRLICCNAIGSILMHNLPKARVPGVQGETLETCAQWMQGSKHHKASDATQMDATHSATSEFMCKSYGENFLNLHHDKRFAGLWAQVWRSWEMTANWKMTHAEGLVVKGRRSLMSGHNVTFWFNVIFNYNANLLALADSVLKNYPTAPTWTIASMTLEKLWTKSLWCGDDSLMSFSKETELLYDGPLVKATGLKMKVEAVEPYPVFCNHYIVRGYAVVDLRRLLRKFLTVSLSPSCGTVYEGVRGIARSDDVQREAIEVQESFRDRLMSCPTELLAAVNCVVYKGDINEWHSIARDMITMVHIKPMVFRGLAKTNVIVQYSYDGAPQDKIFAKMPSNVRVVRDKSGNLRNKKDDIII